MELELICFSATEKREGKGGAAEEKGERWRGVREEELCRRGVPCAGGRGEGVRVWGCGGLVGRGVVVRIKRIGLRG